MSYRISESCNGCGACVRLCPVGAIAGEKKNRHEVNSQLCIECGACGKICPVEAVRDSFGIICERRKRSTWEKPHFNEKLCMSCGICIEACPADCLAWSVPAPGGSPHSLPRLEERKGCLGCGFCVRECPVGAVVMIVPAETNKGIADE